MNLYKALRREQRKKNKRKMVVDGKSVFTLRDEKEKRDREIRRRRKQKNEALDNDL